MNKKKLLEKEVNFIIGQVNQGASVKDVCYMMGISQTTFYSLRKKYNSTQKMSDLNKRRLEKENRELRERIKELEKDKRNLIYELTIYRMVN